MATTSTAQGGLIYNFQIKKNKILVFLEKTQGTPNESSRHLNKTTKVYVRLMFLRVGEIDTLNEKYQAHAAIEARWLIDINKLSSSLSLDDHKLLIEGKSISLIKYGESHWHPQLYIENAVGDLKEQITYSAKRSTTDNEIYVCEHRDIKGSFWEQLELQHFPSDLQDLSISIASMVYDDKVILIADPHHLSGVNREAFVDQQEWKLYKHVDTEQRCIKEFLFQTNDDDGDDDDDEVGSTNNYEDRKRSVLTVTCHAGLYLRIKRQYNYAFIFSSSFKLFLLEWVLSYFIDYSCIFLYFCNSSKVNYFHPFCHIQYAFSFFYFAVYQQIVFKVDLHFCLLQ
jgi:hypothetical protein